MKYNIYRYISYLIYHFNCPFQIFGYKRLSTRTKYHFLTTHVLNPKPNQTCSSIQNWLQIVLKINTSSPWSSKIHTRNYYVFTTRVLAMTYIQTTI